MSRKTISSHRKLTPELREFILQSAAKFNGKALDDTSIRELCRMVKKNARFRSEVHPKAVRRLLQGQYGAATRRHGKKPHHMRNRRVRQLCCLS